MQLDIEIPENALNWLLEKNYPSIRYYTLRDLLKYPPNNQDVVETKKQILLDRRVKNILKKQDPEGYWLSKEHPYSPKYKSSYWQIMILSQLGLDNTNKQIQKACDHIFKFQQKDGSFPESEKEGFRKRYEFKQIRAEKKNKKMDNFGEWVKDKIHESKMSCLTGNICTSLIEMGYKDDERVKNALEWLCEIQNQDGGWLCPYWKAHINDKHSCFMGTITPLDAFSRLSKSMISEKMEKTIHNGAEFLLMHNLFQADHHNYEIINNKWLDLSFPWFFYDILRGLYVLLRLGYQKDKRLNPALEVLINKRSKTGVWFLDNTPIGRMHTSLEQKNKPSKWITLKSYTVLQYFSK